MQRSPHFLIPAEAGNLSVDQTQGVSLYIQVANILRYAILSGAIAPGSRLPTVVELGDHFKVEPADVVLADHLRCPLGAPVARVLRRAIDTKGRGVYLALSWYRGDMFSFAATIPNELLPHLSTGIDGTL